MFVIFGLLSFALFLLAFILLRRSFEGVLLSVDNVIILGVSFLWGIIFPIVYFYSLTNQNNEYLIIISNYDALELIIYYICICVFLFLYVNTFRLVSNKRQGSFLLVEDESIELTNEKSKRLFIATILLLIIGVLSDFLYCQAYGGYLGYLEYSGFIRSGITNMVSNRWSFLIVFRDCVIISSYLLFSQIRKNGKIQFGRFMLFIISFVYSLLILYANRGRMSFLIYVAIFLVTYVVDKRRIRFFNIKSIIFIGIAFLISVAGVEWVSDLVGRTSAFNGLNLICNEVAFVFSNFKLLLNELNIGNARFFVDIVSYPMFLLPSSLWRKIMPDTASDFMTILTFGNKKGQGGLFGETPIDAISIGYLQFGIIGVCIFAIFFGFISAKAYGKISKISNAKSCQILQVCLMIDVFLRSLMYADSYNIVQRCFSLVVFTLIYWGIGLLQKISTRE